MRQCLPNNYPEGLSNLPCSDTMKPNDIFPDVRAVQLENIGGEMIAKVDGTNLWFVHEVKICGIEPMPDGQQTTLPKTTSAEGESFAVDISKNTESLVVINMGTKHIRHEGVVNARVKMHFQDSRYIEAKDIQARTMVYQTSFYILYLNLLSIYIFCFFKKWSCRYHCVSVSCSKTLSSNVSSCMKSPKDRNRWRNSVHLWSLNWLT